MGIIESGNALPLEEFIKQYQPNLSPFRDAVSGTSYSLRLESAATLSAAALESCFSLIEQTSSELYEHSSVGWSPSGKRKEMRLPDLRYVLVTVAPSPSLSAATAPGAAESGDVEAVQGFMSFMLTYEDDHEVIYCYEIHLAPSLRRCGLGRHLMGIMEDVGRAVRVEKLMLTVFVANTGGMNFYHRLGYATDEFSPGPRKLRGGRVQLPSYTILSKSLRWP